MKLELPPTSAGHARRRVPARACVLSEQALQALACWKSQADTMGGFALEHTAHGVCTLIARDLDQGTPVAPEGAEIAAARFWVNDWIHTLRGTEALPEFRVERATAALCLQALDVLARERDENVTDLAVAQERHDEPATHQAVLVSLATLAAEVDVDRAWAWLRTWQRARGEHPVKLSVHRHIVRAEGRVLRAVEAWQRAKRGG